MKLSSVPSKQCMALFFPSLGWVDTSMAGVLVGNAGEMLENVKSGVESSVM